MEWPGTHCCHLTVSQKGSDLALFMPLVELWVSHKTEDQQQRRSYALQCSFIVKLFVKPYNTEYKWHWVTCFPFTILPLCIWYACLSWELQQWSILHWIFLWFRSSLPIYNQVPFHLTCICPLFSYFFRLWILFSYSLRFTFLLSYSVRWDPPCGTL